MKKRSLSSFYEFLRKFISQLICVREDQTFRVISVGIIRMPMEREYRNLINIDET